MKLKIVITILLSMGVTTSKSQGTWTQLSDFGGGNREITAWFQIGNYGYNGMGRQNGVAYSDLWQYDPINDTWTQKANKPGGGVFAPGCFVLGDTAYIICGWFYNGAYQTVWTYIQSSNIWVQKNNFPGSARYGVISFAINGMGYIGMGYSPYKNDFWQYDPVTDSWLQIASFPGSPRVHSTGVAVNGKGYAGLGYNGSSFNDWYEYDPGSNLWSQKTSFPGGARRGTSYFEMNNKIYVATGYNDVSYFNDLWEYNPANDTWTQLTPNLPAAGRYAGFGFGFNDCIFIGTGSNGGVASPVEFDDVWKYCLPASASFGSAQQNLCPGTCTDFYNLSQNAISFQWYFQGASPNVSTDENPTNICYSTPGTYDVTLIVSDSTGTDTVTIQDYITLYPLSPQGISQSGDTLFAFAGSISYQWYYNGNIVSGATDYYYIAPASGNYNVVATDTNGCEVEAVIYDIVARTQELNAVSGLESVIYPNPLHTIATFRLTGKSFSGNVTLEIFNPTGQRIALLFNGKLNQGETRNIEFNGGELSEGIYFYRIAGSGEIISGRLTLIK